ncbi:helix-turn-helix transcriptional regulator, partial [Limisphaera sp. 4302-co]|uniref:helix-turn-helix transcriptional regulator n=1 Tax=Limisphaera sp. 4302-co TaxID=3400417 RepID=UPI003C2685C8
MKLPGGERQWLELAMGCGFRVKAMAAVLRVSERTLERRFAVLERGRLREWLRRKRMEVGRRWLREGTFVKEVAGRLGYGSVSAFCRAYRRRWGHSPCEKRD